MQAVRVAIASFAASLIAVWALAVIARVPGTQLPEPVAQTQSPASLVEAAPVQAMASESQPREAPGNWLLAPGQDQQPTANSQQPSLEREEPAPQTLEQPHLARIAPEECPINVQLSLDATNQYFYHGIIQEDTGLILQPAAKVTVNLYEHDDFKVDALLGAWNSFHSQQTGAGSSAHGDITRAWYELDLIAGVVFTGNRVSLATTYTFLTSPGDAYDTVEELGFTCAYDDRDLLGKIALHPYAMLAIETGANGSDGADSDRGTYLELGIAPGFSFDMGKTPVSLKFPMSVGLSLDDYYENGSGIDDTFGFAQIGVKASMPLPFGDRYGQWTLNASVAALYLGDHTAAFNHGEHFEFIATLGVQLNF